MAQSPSSGDFTRPLIVKFGGSTITDKRKKFAIKLAALKRLASEVAAVKGPLAIVHGGGSFGHPVASEYAIANGYKHRGQLMGLSLTHRAMEKLNAKVIDALQRAGLPAVAIQPSACVVVSGGRIKSMELTPVRKFLELGIVPVFYGDAVPDLDRGMSILSGDQLVVYLARKLNASRVILGVDVDGVYTADPKASGDAKLIKTITPFTWRKIRKFLGAAGERDVTGGMAKKVEELLALAKSGIEAEIVNGAKPGVLKRAILGERGLGTRIVAE
jgi:isopentenyl phosphate kinase